MKRLILCADDYALAPGVSRAIRELAAAGRLNATSVMTPGPDLAAEAERLLAVTPEGFQIGLHVTLTGGLMPLTAPRIAMAEGIAPLLVRAHLRRLDRPAIAAEVEAQMQAFITAFGRPPAFVDGHQHTHLLPTIRDIVVAATTRHAPGAWIRQCGGPRGAGEGVKGRIIAALSRGLRKTLARHHIPTNPAFSGAYDFRRAPSFPAIFPRFLEGLPDGALIMVHPGHVDEALRTRDPVHEPREHEFAYLAGDDFPRTLAVSGFALA